MDDNVMRKYATEPTKPRHHIQFDQGEDRWLCTLLLQRGWRVEYSAASDSYTGMIMFLISAVVNNDLYFILFQNAPQVLMNFTIKEEDGCLPQCLTSQTCWKIGDWLLIKMKIFLFSILCTRFESLSISGDGIFRDVKVEKKHSLE